LQYFGQASIGPLSRVSYRASKPKGPNDRARRGAIRNNPTWALSVHLSDQRTIAARASRTPVNRGGTREETVRGVQIKPVSGKIGAEFRGLDQSKKLSSETVEFIREQLLQFHLLFFP
jgi:hypothetical protein